MRSRPLGSEGPHVYVSPSTLVGSSFAMARERARTNPTPPLMPREMLYVCSYSALRSPTRACPLPPPGTLIFAALSSGIALARSTPLGPQADRPTARSRPALFVTRDLMRMWGISLEGARHAQPASLLSTRHAARMETPIANYSYAE